MRRALKKSKQRNITHSYSISTQDGSPALSQPEIGYIFRRTASLLASTTWGSSTPSLELDSKNACFNLQVNRPRAVFRVSFTEFDVLLTVECEKWSKSDVRKLNSVFVTLREELEKLVSGKISWFPIDEQNKNMLIVGTTRNGEAAIFNYFEQSHWSKKNLDELEACARIIRGAILKGTDDLLEGARKLEVRLGDDTLPEKWRNSRNQKSDYLVGEIKILIRKIWEDPGIQKVWERRKELDLLETFPYFMNNLDRIAVESGNYKPTSLDYYSCRFRTAGVPQLMFRYLYTRFSVFLLGGEKNERRKWMRSFDGVNTICFIASLSEYDQDEGLSSLQESLSFCERLVKNSGFKEANFILLLIDYDLFSSKVTKALFRDPLKSSLKGYKGVEPYNILKTESENVNSPDVQRAINSCAQHIRDLYLKKAENRIGSGVIMSEVVQSLDSRVVRRILALQRKAMAKQSASSEFDGNSV